MGFTEEKVNLTLQKGEEPEVVENQRDLYVEGLPPDITIEQFIEYFSKAGIVRKDEETGTNTHNLSLSHSYSRHQDS